MSECRMTDETWLLGRCLHSGQALLGERRRREASYPTAESEAGVPDPTIAEFLIAACQACGSSALLAARGHAVMPKARSYRRSH